MQIKLIAFGIAKDILETQYLKLNLENKDTTIQGVKQALLQKYPAFAKLKSLSFAVNEEYQNDDFILSNNDEVVIIPPVSGG